MDSIKKYEQKVVTQTCADIKLYEKDYFEESSESGKHFYNVDLDWYEQKEYQQKHIKAENYLKNNIYPLLSEPYFGRLDYLTVEAVEGTAYIGHIGYQKGNVTIHDWRSDKGQAFRSGRLFYQGYNVKLKRNLDIKEAILKQYYDSIARGSNTSKSNDKYNVFQNIIEENKMKKDILSTINQVQNDIVELPLDRNVVLHGVPGSGKTAIGGYRLSSIAFKLSEEKYENFKLLYITPSEILRANTVKFFNKIDMSYINFINFIDIFKLAERVPTNNPQTKQVVFGKNKIKGKLTNYADNFNGINFEIELPDKSIVEIPKNDVMIYKNIYKAHAQFIFGKKHPKKEISRFEAYIRSEKVFDLMNDQSFLVFINNFSVEDFLRLNKYNFKSQIHKRFKVRLSNEDADYLLLFTQLFLIFSNVSTLKLNHEVKTDILDYVIQKNLKAVFLDESQDYTLMDIKLLKVIYPNATFTLCGDVNQSSGVNYVQKDWDLFIKELNAFFSKFILCFRSTSNIVKAFNKRMVNREYGKAKAVSNKRGIVKSLKNTKELFDESVQLNKDTCVIFMDRKTEIKLKFLFKETDVTIMHAYNVKGLEFKTVIIYDVESIKQNKQSTKFYYMLISRALENLFVVSHL
ncbi:MAG: hypothetical protein ACOCP4_06865 [Candidatus Woesearchaeota archaeon]